MIFDLRFGAWQTALADVEEVDAAIVDTPYSDRVHEGNDRSIPRDQLGYAAMDPSLVSAWVEHWEPRVRGWIVQITSHDLVMAWSEALEAAGRYVFAPLPLYDEGMTVRLLGDGPASWTCWLVVARRRNKEAAGWGALPGGYRRRPGDERSPRRGGKPLGVMREIVRDYSRPGDLVLDTHAGGGTTLLASILEGRRAVGAEIEREAWEQARDRCLPHVPRCEALHGVQSGRTLELF